jgi:2'-5' RNA ligase superfamily
VIGTWRREYTTDGAAGMPAHVTLLYPFAPAGEAESVELGPVFARMEPFGYTLVEVREFDDGVVYLTPDPSAPFVELSRALVQRFLAYRPYRGELEIDELIPHVTVVHTDADRARADAAASVSEALPIVCNASEAWLMHEVEGRWQRHTPFRLGR